MLDRPGAPLQAVRASVVVESLLAAVPGVILAVPLGLVTARAGSTVLERTAFQEWGALEPAWGTLALTAAATLLLVPAIALVSVSDARVRAGSVAFARASRSRSGGAVSSPRFLGSRLAARSRRSTWLGAIAISMGIAIGAASLLVVGVARASYAALYEPVLPSGVVALSVPRPLTDQEAAVLAASSNSALLEDRRVAFARDASAAPVPVVLDSPATQCLREQPDPLACADASGTVVERSVAVADAQQVEGLLGRELTPLEREAFLHGDGLLLTRLQENARLVAPGRYQAIADAEPFELPIDPVAVDGFDLDRYPGLLVNDKALASWGLFLDDTPISYYLLSPIVAPVDDNAVRAALPADLQPVAEVLIDTGPATLDDLVAATRSIMALSIVLVFLVVVLLMMAWANDSAPVLRSLRSLGMRRRELAGVLIARGARAVATAVAAGLVLSLVLTWLFGRYVGVPVPVVGFGWLLPALAALAALLLAAGAHVALDDDERIVRRPRGVIIDG